MLTRRILQLEKTRVASYKKKLEVMQKRWEAEVNALREENMQLHAFSSDLQKQANYTSDALVASQHHVRAVEKKIKGTKETTRPKFAVLSQALLEERLLASKSPTSPKSEEPLSPVSPFSETEEMGCQDPDCSLRRCEMEELVAQLQRDIARQNAAARRSRLRPEMLDAITQVCLVPSGDDDDDDDGDDEEPPQPEEAVPGTDQKPLLLAMATSLQSKAKQVQNLVRDLDLDGKRAAAQAEEARWSALRAALEMKEMRRCLKGATLVTSATQTQSQELAYRPARLPAIDGSDVARVVRSAAHKVSKRKSKKAAAPTTLPVELAAAIGDTDLGPIVMILGKRCTEQRRDLLFAEMAIVEARQQATRMAIEMQYADELAQQTNGPKRVGKLAAMTQTPQTWRRWDAPRLGPSPTRVQDRVLDRRGPAELPTVDNVASGVMLALARRSAQLLDPLVRRNVCRERDLTGVLADGLAHQQTGPWGDRPRPADVSADLPRGRQKADGTPACASLQGRQGGNPRARSEQVPGCSTDDAAQQQTVDAAEHSGIVLVIPHRRRPVPPAVKARLEGRPPPRRFGGAQEHCAHGVISPRSPRSLQPQDTTKFSNAALAFAERRSGLSGLLKA
eukprot:TRINITY_DN8576_c0_g1_i2.p1 TRINITY_DN8576_c0_g1~~TRINITY_DN8576_c0_g1_i2.p1  ORF type:complete len:621 (+),score=142.59 TRINITY_DN8576_c0_g1_i2:98-1960(+)